MGATFYVGSYCSADQEGILKLDTDVSGRQLTKVWGYSGIENPSFLLCSKKHPIMYAVEELNPNGRIQALHITENGLESLCTLSTGGADPCHLELDEEEKFLFAANYSSGSLAVFHLDDNGVPTCRTDLIEHTGHGPNPVRQEAAHVHFSCFHNGVLFVNDLGIDTVSRYVLNYETGKLSKAAPDIQVPAGFGPRHLCFSPSQQDLVYIMCELASTVCVVRFSDTGYEIIQTICALPEDFEQSSIAAAIKLSPDGKSLFTSNRGHDSIAVFDIQPDGTLALRQICKTGGRAPRDFSFVGNWLIAANQDSSRITVLEYDANYRSLDAAGISYESHKPVLILPV